MGAVSEPGPLGMLSPECAFPWVSPKQGPGFLHDEGPDKNWVWPVVPARTTSSPGSR